MSTKYNPAPVIGYCDGLVVSDETPLRVKNNDWFCIEGRFYNVHPKRSDLGGYPVRWFTDFMPDGYTEVEKEAKK